MPSLYVHIPFCQKRCLFCSFVVVIGQGHRVQDYLLRLAKEAQTYAGFRFDTVYIGGGTPTFLSRGQLVDFVGMLKKNFSFSSDVEFTIEANPEGIDRAKLETLLDLGVNRISLGIQSFNDGYLKFLGRNHDAQTARSSFELLRTVGFRNINLDLMVAFPQQTDPQIKEDLTAMAQLGSEHISVYALSVEEPSRFFARNLRLENEEVRARQYSLVVDQLNSLGLSQYEISNFCRSGKESCHNLNYWQGGDYIGLGVGAHSYLNGERFWNHSRLAQYLNAEINPVQGREKFTPTQHLLEMFLIGLRMNRGVDLVRLEQQLGCKFPPEKQAMLNALFKAKLVEAQANRVCVTDAGRLVLDEISARLI